jgi:hypothetical protein
MRAADLNGMRRLAGGIMLRQFLVGSGIPVERWQLLGPMTAMNGILLFGWSTAVIFEVLRRMRRNAPIGSVGYPQHAAFKERASTEIKSSRQ